MHEVAFILVWLLAGSLMRDDRFFQDASLQLARVAEARPDDWRVLDEQGRRRAQAGRRLCHLSAIIVSRCRPALTMGAGGP